MRYTPMIVFLIAFLFGCTGHVVQSPQEWKALAQKGMTERLQTTYDTVFDDVGFIKARAGTRMDVYDVVDGKVEHFFSVEKGESQGYEFEWNKDGSLRFVSSNVNGEVEGTAVEFDYERGWQILREYGHGKLLSMDSIPLTERPRIELFAPPGLKTSKWSTATAPR